jgi:hypothetical protein
MMWNWMLQEIDFIQFLEKKFSFDCVLHSEPLRPLRTRKILNSLSESSEVEQQMQSMQTSEQVAVNYSKILSALMQQTQRLLCSRRHTVQVFQLHELAAFWFSRPFVWCRSIQSTCSGSLRWRLWLWNTIGGPYEFPVHESLSGTPR